MRAGLYWTELGSGSAQSPSGASIETAARALYNYSKVAFAVGLQSNIFALLKGDFLRARVTQLERQREALLAEIQTRQQRIAALELEINRYEAQNLLELEQRRAAAEAELRAEREALQRLEERLQRIEQQRPPPRRR
jgi:septal ring factor EnvC (AmiA/AmiB activator)